MSPRRGAHERLCIECLLSSRLRVTLGCQRLLTIAPDVINALEILVAGGYSNPNNMGNDAFRDFIVARYTSSGALDSSFGTGGRTITRFGFEDDVFALALQSDGSCIRPSRFPLSREKEKTVKVLLTLITGGASRQSTEPYLWIR